MTPLDSAARAHSHDPGTSASEPRARVTRSPVFWTFVLFAFVGAAFLVTAHPTHAWGYLPYLLLLACPLLHFAGHGRGGHAGHGRP